MSHAFDEVAETYDAVRPGYPEELFDDIARLVHLEPGSRVLEVGCGTGQATLSFARRGLRVHCVEPGGSLLEVARRKLRGYPVEFSLSRFEDWPLKKAYFDLAASGTAWHWVDPEAGYRKLSAALKPRGFIALFWNLHPTPYTGFFEEVQEVYRRRVPEWSDPNVKPSTDQRISEIGEQIRSSGFFEEPTVRRYVWQRTYSSDDYVKLMDTYSDHRALPEETRRLLYLDVKRLADERFGGAVERPYLTALFVAWKSP